jgi:WD40 repeat protein
VSSAPGSGGRVLLAAGTATYRYGDLVNLDRVPDALRCVAETLTDLGYRQTAPGGTGVASYLLDPSLQELKNAVREAATSAPVVVVYYTGHGMRPQRDPYLLVTAQATSGQLEDNALEARQFARLVLRRDADDQELPPDEQPQVLIILDCCFSGSGGLESLRESLEGMGNAKVWWLASASSLEYAQQSRFAEALKQALLDPNVGSSQELLGLDWVTDRVNAILADIAQEARWFPPGGQSCGLPPFFPNPRHVPGVAGLTVADQHWVSRLRGVPAGSAATGFYITGRTGRFRVIEDLSAWMHNRHSSGLAVVTGSPGCGKSAMLALPVLLTEARSRDALVAGAEAGSLLARAAALFDGLPVLGVHARGMNPYQVAEAIAKHLGRAADSPGELLADLDDHPERSWPIVVIDAADEARDPRSLMTDLVLPLAHRPGLRIVVGTRRRALPTATDTSALVDLDSDDYRDPQALVDYAHQLLIASREPEVTTPYRGRHDDAAATVAAAIADKASERPTAAGQGESFLLAQLLARAVRGRDQALEVNRAGLAEQLPTSVGEAFDEDLRRLVGKRESAARILLTALAWAKGPGLPWEGIWLPVAQGLASLSETATERLGRDDVRRLLDHASAYIVEDVGPGQRSVFRLSHDLLAAHLRGATSAGQTHSRTSGQKDREQRRRRAEKVMTDTLIATVPVIRHARRDWMSAHPYLQTYLAQHAAAAGTEELAALTDDMDFLATADPATLSPLLSPAVPELREMARIYRRTRPLLGDDVGANAGYLQEAKRALTGTPTSSGEVGISPRYHTYFGSVRQDDSLLTLTGHTGSVTSVAFGTAADGRLLLASAGGDHDGTVRLWEPETGSLISEPLTSHARAVTSVAFGTTGDGGLLLAFADRYEGIVWLWDPDSGSYAGEPLTGHASGVSTVAFGTTADGRLLLASIGRFDETVQLWHLNSDQGPSTGHAKRLTSAAFGRTADGRLLLALADGDHNGSVRLWDLETDTLATKPLTGHAGGVSTVAFGTTAHKRLLLASATRLDGTVRVWDPTRGALAAAALTDHAGGVSTVAFGTTADGRLLLASAGSDGRVHLWDPLTGSSAAAPLTGHTKAVTSVAFGITADGRLLLAAGDSGGTVRLWDPTTGDPVAKPLTGHGRGVTSVAFGANADGRLLLAAGARFGGKVRLWDPVTASPAGRPLTGHTGEVTSVAFGTTADMRLLLASADSGGTVRLWNPTTGVVVGEPLASHSSPVYSVAFGTTADGRLLLASGAYDATVRIWEAVSSAPAAPPLSGHIGEVTSVAFGTTADARLLLASADSGGTVRLWDPLTGSPLAERLTEHGSRVTSVAFGATAAEQLMLVSASADRTVRLWDADSKVCIATLRRRTAVRSIATMGALLAIADDEGVCVIEPQP